MVERVVRPGPGRRMRGGTVLGFLVGLIAGLSIAVVVAMIVTRAPVPFLDKGKRTPEPALEPKSLSEAPDPNAPLHATARPAAGAAVPAASAPAATRPAVAPSSSSAPIVASAPASAPASVGAPGALPGTANAPTDASYLLQAGAFRSSSEAENMKVRLALIGFEARVLDAQVNGQTLYRVRVGPYAQLDSMNRARARLAENGIEASVVRQR